MLMAVKEFNPREVAVGTAAMLATLAALFQVFSTLSVEYKANGAILPFVSLEKPVKPKL